MVEFFFGVFSDKIFIFIISFFKTSDLAPFNDLNHDCFQTILSFQSPLEIWAQRTTSSIWKSEATIRLSRIDFAECYGEWCDGSIRSQYLLVDICPNLKSVNACWGCFVNVVFDDVWKVFFFSKFIFYFYYFIFLFFCNGLNNTYLISFVGKMNDTLNSFKVH